MAMKTTLNLDDDLLREAKMRAAEEGITLTRVVEEALRGALTSEEGADGGEVRWVVVDGGPPRVDIDDRNALYEFMERSD
jgi:plasmid stability protein